METRYFQIQAEQVVRLRNQATETKCVFFQHTLLVAVTFFAIVISLQENSQYALQIRLVFLLSTVLLVLGILCSALVYKGLVSHQESAAQKFADEVKKSIMENVRVPAVFVHSTRLEIAAEKGAYISLIASLIGFTLYIILTTF